LFAILIGVILTSGWAYATVCDKEEAKSENRHVITAKVVDETYGVRGNEIHKFDAQRTPWVRHGSKAVTIDTIAWFSAEGPSWQDEMMAPAEWDTMDATIEKSYWHVADFNVCTGDSAWWCGDPSIGSGGYSDGWYQMLTTDNFIALPATADSIYLTYNSWLRCEENWGFPRQYSWDGYNVRLALKSDPDNFFEIYPYQPADDSSYYRGKLYHEWDSLYCWGYNGDIGGGFSQDTSSGCIGRMYDLLSYAGDSVKVRYIFCTDGAYNTLDDSTLFGLVLDDIKVTAYTPGKGEEVLFTEDCETLPHNMVPTVSIPSGTYWWLAFGGQGGSVYKAHDGDPMTEKYASNLEDMLVSPKIAHADLDTNLADLWLMYYLRGNFNDLDEFPEVDFVINEYRTWDSTQVGGGEWRCVSQLFGTTCYVFMDFDNADWWGMDQWGDDLRNLTPLITDPAHNVWDTLEVAILVHTDSDTCENGGKGLQVDNVTISGRIGFPNDIGVVGAKIPNPNANDVKLFMDTLAVENYGFNTASSGAYMVKMTIVDSLGTVVFGPGTQIAAFPTPQIDPLQTALVPLDASVCDFTLTEEGVYDFFIWTEWSAIPDDDPANDTLRTEYTFKDLLYPYAYNYPAGQGQLRYHDQAFYSYPSLNIRKMEANDVAAVHFTPESSLYPFDIALGLPELKHVGQTYNFNVYGPGVDDDHPGALWTQVQFTTDTSDELKYVRVELSDSAACQHLSSDFWMGVEFPTGTGGEYVMGCEASDPGHAVASWDRSYLYWDPDAVKAQDWHKYEYDLMITCVIRFRTVDAAAMVSESGPPMKNSSGNLYLDWDDVSQAHDYLIYRATDVTGSFPLLDSAAVSNYTDANVVGTVGTDYYYLFHTRHQDGYSYDKTSKAVGEFDKAMLNAK
jgi:hypothetical protein